jgi:hypothetical protein
LVALCGAFAAGAMAVAAPIVHLLVHVCDVLGSYLLAYQTLQTDPNLSVLSVSQPERATRCHYGNGSLKRPKRPIGANGYRGTGVQGPDQIASLP